MKLIRGILAALSILIVFSIIAYTFCTWVPLMEVKDLAFNDLVKEGLQLKLEQSRSQFQLALLVIGALWALIIAKKDEASIVLSDWQESIMFACGNFLLIVSILFHIFYVEHVSYLYEIAAKHGGKSIPDVFDSGINNSYRFQIWALMGGIIITAFALFSAHKLKKR